MKASPAKHPPRQGQESKVPKLIQGVRWASAKQFFQDFIKQVTDLGFINFHLLCYTPTLASSGHPATKHESHASATTIGTDQLTQNSVGILPRVVPDCRVRFLPAKGVTFPARVSQHSCCIKGTCCARLGMVTHRIVQHAGTPAVRNKPLHTDHSSPTCSG